MSNITSEQKEVIESINEYLSNLIPAMEKVTAELDGDMKEDTWEYLHMIIDGFNWVVEAYNVTSQIFAEKTEINESEVEKAVSKLGDAYRKRVKEDASAAIKEFIVPFLKKLKSVAEQI